MKETNVTIISTDLNRSIADNYKGFSIIDDNFTYQELLTKKRVIFFNILNDLKKEELDKLFNYLNDNNIEFIVFTNNLELALYTKYLVVYDKTKILAEGLTLDLLKNDKLLKRLGFELPFYVDLSILLSDYGLLDKIILDKKELKEELWK